MFADRAFLRNASVADNFEENPRKIARRSNGVYNNIPCLTSR